MINPADSSTVSGLLNLQVNIVDDTSSVHSVQYLINNESMFGPTSVYPFSNEWHSTNLWDGISQIRAIALDITGQTLAASEAVNVHVSNFNGYSFDNVLPSFDATMSGEVEVSTRVSHTMTKTPKHWPEGQAFSSRDWYPFLFTYLFIDGKLIDTYAYTSPGYSKECDSDAGPCHSDVTFSIDTTSLFNGWHSVLIQCVYDWNSFRDERGMLYYSIEVQNERSVVDIQPTWRDIYLNVGATHQLAVKAVFNDFSEEEYDGDVVYTIATWPLDGSDIISVDPSGLVTALATGLTSVTASALTYEHKIRVVVSNVVGFPHYTKSGSLRMNYTAGQSQFTRSVRCC